MATDTYPEDQPRDRTTDAVLADGYKEGTLEDGGAHSYFRQFICSACYLIAAFMVTDALYSTRGVATPLICPNITIVGDRDFICGQPLKVVPIGDVEKIHSVFTKAVIG